MGKGKVAIGFVNGLGNFIFLTSAVKVLKKWGYDHIDLITDPLERHYEVLLRQSEGIFDNVYTECDADTYDKIFVCGWSLPTAVKHVLNKFNQNVRIIHWDIAGIHEVQAYLDMIGASFEDFDGYLLEPASKPKLNSPRPRIALAHPSGTEQATKKSWDKFPELSIALKKLGYSVILLGVKGELEGCEYTSNFIDKLTVEECAKVLTQCDMLIAASTAMTLIADAVGTPVLLLEGPMATSRAHPLISPYRIVRKYFSCAPCFQTPFWRHCNDPLCMKMISVEDVLHQMHAFLDDIKPNYQWDIRQIKSKAKIKPVECEGKAAYLFPCFDRAPFLRNCINSFKDSNPMEGVAFFLNDASTNPEIEEMILNLKDDPPNGVEIRYIEVDIAVKRNLMKKHSRASAHAYNTLILEMLEVDLYELFDYVHILDSDVAFQPYWSQRITLLYEHLKQEHDNFATLSAFNQQHPKYQHYEDLSKEIDSSPYGDYKLTKGCSLHIMCSMDFMKAHYGTYDISGSGTSADIRKNAELRDKGFIMAKSIPSMVQHIGALYSTLRNAKPGVLAEDFI